MVFRKLFGKRGGGGGGNNGGGGGGGIRSSIRHKMRLSPSTQTVEGMRQSHPMYQYAMKEYAQTVPHIEGIVQDSGKIRPSFSMNHDEEMATIVKETIDTQSVQSQPPLPQQQQADVMMGSADGANNALSSSGASSQQPQQQTIPPPPPPPPLPPPPQQQQPTGTGVSSALPSILRVPSYKSDISGLGSVQKAYQRIVFSPRTEYIWSEDDDVDQDNHSYIPPEPLNASHHQPQKQHHHHYRIEPPMPDTTYEEWYGDAYIGGPLRYLYPSGYQSMRPRSGPWKLSIVVCLLFTWLSLFVIGHCSDKAAEQYDGFYNYNANYNNKYNNNANGSDEDNNANSNNNQQYQYNVDTNDIDTKWCGSVLLYWMWVISMLITGLSAAYCGVIGYIKIRDFAVANSRSQPPGVVIGKSDYYVQLSSSSSSITANHRRPHQHYRNTTPMTNNGGQPVHPSQYQPTIYQADGNPQFWGNQIYRPTQAAVMVTSR